MLKDKSNLITDFTNKLWNLTPDINFSEDADVETFLPAPRKVITPTKSFDNLLNFEFSEAETGSADHDLPKLEGEETDLIEDLEEVEEIINYNAEASYRVQVTATAMQETNHQPEPEKAESEEQETVLDQLINGTSKLEAEKADYEEPEVVEIVLDPETVFKVTNLSSEQEAENSEEPEIVENVLDP